MYCVYPAAIVKTSYTDKAKMGLLPIHHFSPFPSASLQPHLCQPFLLSRNSRQTRLWGILESTLKSLTKGQFHLLAEPHEQG